MIIELFPANITEICLHLIVTNPDNTKCLCWPAPGCSWGITAYMEALLATFVGGDRVLLLKFFQQSTSKPLPERCVVKHTEPNSLTANYSPQFIIFGFTFLSLFWNIWPGFDCAFKGDLFWLGLPSWAGRFCGLRPCKTGCLSTSLLTDLQQLFYKGKEVRGTLGGREGRNFFIFLMISKVWGGC